MSLRFLSRMAEQPLPYRTSDRVEVLHVEVLRNAQLILADPATAASPEAVVHGITPQGYALIRRIVAVVT